MIDLPLKKSIKIKGSTYKIRTKKKLLDDDGHECDGLHDHEKKIIWIQSDLKGENKRRTFLHEFFHAYLFECHVREGLDSQLEEVIVETLSQGIDEHFEVKWRKRVSTKKPK